MDKISIISSDARYEALNEILLKNGFDSCISDVNTLNSPKALILPIKSALADEDFFKISQNLSKRTIVFSGESDRLARFFDGKIINYARDEEFLDKNAYITAECALGFAIMEMKKSVKDSKFAIIGYGRIGKHLCKILLSLGARVSVCARRDESRKTASEAGAVALDPEAMKSALEKSDFDVLYNTVPQKIIEKSISDSLSPKTRVYDLASLPGGFEDTDFPKRLLALPGKIMPYASAMAIFDFVKPYIV